MSVSAPGAGQAPLIVANASGQEVGTVWPGYGGGDVGGTPTRAFAIGPYMYGYGSPLIGRDEAPTPMARDIRRMLEIDGKAQQVFSALTQSLRSAKWEVTDGPEAAWVRQWITDMDPPFEQVIAQIATACAYDRSVFEEVWTVKPDGRVTPVRCGYRPPDNLTIWLDDQGRISEITQQVRSQEVNIPLERSLVYLHNQDRAPGVGIGDMTAVWAGHWRKRNVIAMWQIYIRRAAQPWAWGKAAAPGPTDIQSMATRLASLSSGGVLGLAPDESVGALDAGAQASAVFMSALQWIDSQSTAATLTQFLDLGQSRVGSFALSRDHSDLFTLGRDATLIEIASAVQQQLVDRALYTNFPSLRDSGTKLPQFKFQPLAEADVTQLVTLLQNVITAPAIPVEVQPIVAPLVRAVAGTLGIDIDDTQPAANPALAAAASRVQQILGAAQPAQPATVSPPPNGARPTTA